MTGALKPIQTIKTLPTTVTPKRDHHRGNSDLHLHPNGCFLYVACRSPNPGLIAIFNVDKLSGKLSLVGHESTRGLVPRNFKLVTLSDKTASCESDPAKVSGLPTAGKNNSPTNFLVVGNQETRTVCSFAIDDSSGKLSFVSEVSVGKTKPCNLAFL